MLTIKTNHQFRSLVYGYELTETEKAEFDYLDWTDPDTESQNFVRYRGRVYNVSEFMATSTSADANFNDWDGYASDSYFSGVLIKLSDDCEQAKMATYYS